MPKIMIPDHTVSGLIYNPSHYIYDGRIRCKLSYKLIRPYKENEFTICPQIYKIGDRFSIHGVFAGTYLVSVDYGNEMDAWFGNETLIYQSFKNIVVPQLL